jgi:nitroreductase
MNDFRTLLRKRRSIREYLDRDVPPEIIREILVETCLAPSAMNRQPWRFSVVADRSAIRRLSDDSKRNLLSDLEADPSSPLRRYEDLLRNPAFNVFYDAPCVVYVAGPGEVKSLQVDCALAVSYFMFAAAARGLGTCWVALGANVRDPALLGELGITADLKIVAPVIVGYPKAVPELPERNEPVILCYLS